MGGGKSESKTSTDKSTRITTKTNTKIGDIGLTGKNAIELAAVLVNGVTQLGEQATEQLDLQTQAFKASAQTQTEALKGIEAVKTGETSDSIKNNLPLLVAAGAAGLAFVTLVNK